MKRILVVATLAVLASCSKVGDNEFLISGSAEGIENGKLLGNAVGEYQLKKLKTRKD